MRPNVLRMASSLKQEDDGMEDILQTNDDLLRVLDTYKRVVGGGGRTNGPQTGRGGVKTDVPEEAGAVGGGDGGLGLGGGGDAGDTLIDLADLDFGSIPAPNVSAMTPSTADSLLDALGTLGKTPHSRQFTRATLHDLFVSDLSATGTQPVSQNTVCSLLCIEYKLVDDFSSSSLF